MNERLVVSEQEQDAVLKLDAPRRYSYFIKRVVDWETAWGLWENGWALMDDDTGQSSFPLWPALEFAKACSTGVWATYQPEAIDLAGLLGELLPLLRKDKIQMAVFPTPFDRGVLVNVSQLEESLRAECQEY